MGLFSKFSKNKQEAAGQDSGYYSKADDQAVLERARSKRAGSADGPAARRSRSGDDPALPEKKRARRRLVGAVALALGVAIGLPMLLDSEPKPLASDIAIQIPSKDKPAEPASVPHSNTGRGVPDVAALDKNEEIVDAPAPVKPAAAPAPVAAAPATKPAAAAPVPAPAASLAAAPAANTATPAVKPVHTEPAPPAKDLAKEAAAKAAADKLALEAKLAKEHKALELKEAKERAEAKAKAEHEQKLADAKAEKARAELEAKARQDAKAKLEQEQKLAKAKADAEAKHPKSDDSTRAMAILEDKPSDTRYMVQVAAVASQEKVDELQNKLKEAGIKSFTQKVNTAGGGALTRIRVGPFSSKDEAEKVRAKLSKIGLSSSLATS